jgi:hypothetical protein
MYWNLDYPFFKAVFHQRYIAVASTFLIEISSNLFRRYGNELFNRYSKFFLVMVAIFDGIKRRYQI